MFLFLISLILIFLSSYLITSVLKPKENFIGFVYLFLIAFAQIILTFEILSLFSAINQICFLTMNGIFAGLVLLIWQKYKRPLWKLKSNNLLRRIINSLKLDKSLRVLAFGFSVFIISAVFLCAIMPVNNGDALSYHLARCLFWLGQGNLNHFEIPDVRNTCLPINSELLYSWVLLFVRRDVGIGFFSFFGYVFSMFSIFNILGLIGYCVRKRLWVIFIVSSFASVIVQSSTTEIDVVISGLVLSGIFLFWYALKNNEKAPVFVSSLIFAIAAGTKPTAFMIIPSVFLIFLSLSFKYRNYKFLLSFLLAGAMNFLIFSSYNYILNYLDFSNFMGPQSFIAINKNPFGFKGAVSNFIKHIYMFFSFTGFKWEIYLSKFIAVSESKMLAFLHVSNFPDSLYSVPKNENMMLLYDTCTGTGILGFLVYLPCAIFSLFRFKPIFKKSFFLALFGISFFLTLFVMSCLINYSIFDARYIVAFIIVSSPVLIYSYEIKFKPIKYLIIAISLFYLIIISSVLKNRPFFRVINSLKNKESIVAIRRYVDCVDEPYCDIRDKIKQEFSTNTKVLVFANAPAEKIYFIKLLQLDGYSTDFKLLENAKNINFNNYNLLVIKNNKQLSYLRNLLPIKNEEIPCDYGYIGGYLKTPSFTRCQISEHFLLKNNFSVYFEDTELSSGEKYFIYLNKSNPPRKK